MAGQASTLAALEQPESSPTKTTAPVASGGGGCQERRRQAAGRPGDYGASMQKPEDRSQRALPGSSTGVPPSSTLDAVAPHSKSDWQGTT